MDEFETLRGALREGFPNDRSPHDEALLKPFNPAGVLQCRPSLHVGILRASDRSVR